MREDEISIIVKHTDIVLSHSHLETFSKAIIEFWNDVPEYLTKEGAFEVPDWFGKAYTKDMGNK